MKTKLNKRDLFFLKQYKKLIQEHNKDIDSIVVIIKEILDITDKDADLDDWITDVFLNDWKNFNEHFKEFCNYANIEILND